MSSESFNWQGFKTHEDVYHVVFRVTETLAVKASPTSGKGVGSSSSIAFKETHIKKKQLLNYNNFINSKRGDSIRAEASWHIIPKKQYDEEYLKKKHIPACYIITSKIYYYYY